MRNSKAVVVISIFIAQILYLSYIYYGYSGEETDYILQGWMYTRGDWNLTAQGSLLQLLIAAAIKLGFTTHMKLRFLMELLSIFGWVCIYLFLKQRDQI